MDTGTGLVVDCKTGMITTETVSIPSLTLSEAKAQQRKLIDLSYSSVMLQGFSSSSDGTERTYLADLQSLQQIAWVRDLTQAVYPPQGLGAKLIDGTRVNLDYAQMQQLITDAQTFILTNHMKQDTYHQQIDGIQESNFSTLQDAISAVTSITWS